MVNDVFYLIGGDIITGYNPYMTSAFGTPIYETIGLNEQYTPPGYGTVPPTVSVSSPENDQTYTSGNVPLNFTVNRDGTQISQLKYSIDQNSNTTINENTTLIELSSGNHTLTVTATDTNGNTGTSQTINFTIAQPKASVPEFPTWTALSICLGSNVDCSHSYPKKEAKEAKCFLTRQIFTNKLLS